MKNIVFFTILMVSQLVFSQVYPTPINLDNVPNETYVIPTEVPGYLLPYTNRYGNIVTRISDIGEFNLESQQLGHNYSKDQTENSDGSLIKLAGYPAAILDGETYEFLYWSPIPSYGRWANTNPNIIYGTHGNKFESHDVISNSRTILHTFSNFNSVDFGFGEGNQDFNDEYVGLIGFDNQNNKHYIVYNIITNTYVTKPIPNGQLDWFSVSPSGEYAIAQWVPNGPNMNQGILRMNIDLTNETHLTDYSAHGSFGFLKEEDGLDEVFLQFGNQPQWDNEFSLEMVYLETGDSVNTFYWSYNIHGTSGIWGGHISYAINRPGYFYISEGCCPYHTTLPREIFALDVMENKIERFGKTHTNETVAYNHEARGSVNRNGTKVVFTSNYYDSYVSTLSSGYAFIVEVPQEILSVENNESISDLLIFPNPTNSLIYSNKEYKDIIIYDILGRLVSKSNDLSHLNYGLYIVKLKFNNIEKCIKIIKK